MNQTFFRSTRPSCANCHRALLWPNLLTPQQKVWQDDSFHSEDDISTDPGMCYKVVWLPFCKIHKTSTTTSMTNLAAGFCVFCCAKVGGRRHEMANTEHERSFREMHAEQAIFSIPFSLTYTGYQILWLSPNDTFVCMFHQFPTWKERAIDYLRPHLQYKCIVNQV